MSESLEQLQTEVERLRKENTYLRGMVQMNPNWKCVYFGFTIPSMAHCPHGFPGCSCADDLLLAQLEAECHRAKVTEDKEKILEP